MRATRAAGGLVVVATAAGDPRRCSTGTPDGEVKIHEYMLYPYTDRSDRPAGGIDAMSVDERLDVIRTYAGERTNRRHRPGRALERTMYRFDVPGLDIFRDLQRHRMLTIEWQHLTTDHGYTLPPAVVAAGAEADFHASMVRSADLHDALADHFRPTEAAYAVALAFRVRYVMQFNTREAMHMIELRTTPQGHPEYRKVCQEMYRLIADQAGHRALAQLMTVRGS